MDGLLPSLQGQPAWVVIVVVIVAATAYVMVRVWRRAGDEGGGKAALREVDSAAEFLTEKALEERGLRRDAERERDEAVTTRETALTDLRRVRDVLEQARADLERCAADAHEVARRAIEEERKRRDTP